MSFEHDLSQQLYCLALRLDCYSPELQTRLLQELEASAKQLEFLAVQVVLYTRNKALLVHEFAQYDAAEPLPYASATLSNSQGTVQHASHYSAFIPISLDEIIRMAQAIAVVEQKGELCPANWHPGKRTMKADTWDVADYILKELLA